MILLLEFTPLNSPCFYNYLYYYYSYHVYTIFYLIVYDPLHTLSCFFYNFYLCFYFFLLFYNLYDDGFNCHDEIYLFFKGLLHLLFSNVFHFYFLILQFQFFCLLLLLSVFYYKTCDHHNLLPFLLPFHSQMLQMKILYFILFICFLGSLYLIFYHNLQISLIILFQCNYMANYLHI